MEPIYSELELRIISVDALRLVERERPSGAELYSTKYLLQTAWHHYGRGSQLRFQKFPYTLCPNHPVPTTWPLIR